MRPAPTRCEIAARFCRHEEAEHWLARALADAAADADGPTDACLAERLVAKARGQGARTVEATLRAVQASDSGTDPARVQIARAWLAYERAYGAPAPAREADLAVARRSNVAVDALMSAVDAVRVLRREPVRAVGLFLHASEQAQRVGLVRDAVVATINAGTTLRGLGEHEKAAACFDISESVARQTGWPGLLGTSRTQLGAFLRAQDRLEEAHQLLVEAHLALVPTPPGVNRANACSELALVRLRLRDEPLDSLAGSDRPMVEARDARPAAAAGPALPLPVTPLAAFSTLSRSGTGGGPSATPLTVGPSVRLDRPDRRPPLASLVALRLVGPRTGVRITNTHPTAGTGLPPMRRPSSNSHS